MVHQLKPLSFNSAINLYKAFVIFCRNQPTLHYYFFSFFFFFFLWSHLQHMKFPRPRKSELRLPAHATAVPTQDPNCIRHLHCRLWQCQILNPPSAARNWTTTSQPRRRILNPLSRNRTAFVTILIQSVKMDLSSTIYIYLTDLRGLNAKRQQDCREIKQPEKPDFIESRITQSMVDIKSRAWVASPIGIQSCEKDRRRMGWNLSWALKKRWEFNRKRGGQSRRPSWWREQRRRGEEVPASGYHQRASVLFIWQEPPLLSGGHCVTVTSEFPDKSDPLLSEDFSWKTERERMGLGSSLFNPRKLESFSYC